MSSMSSTATDAERRAQYDEMNRAKAFFSTLIQACMDGDEEKVKKDLSEYVKKNPHTTTEDVLREFQSEGKTIFHVAASSGRPNILRFLLDQIGDKTSVVNKQDKNGFSPLIFATISESSECMQELIKHGASVNVANSTGAAPIHFAAGDGSVARMEILVGRKADVNLMSETGTSIHWAAGKGRTDAIKYLISQGADINVRNENGLTAVLMAACAGSDDTCATLISAGADVGDIVSGNLTVMHICAENGMETSVHALLGVPR